MTANPYTMAVLSEEDRILIRYFRQKHNYGAKKIVKEFPEKNWYVGTVGKFLRHLRENNGSIKIKFGRGRKKTSRTQENITIVRNIVENVRPEESVGTRKIAKRTRIHRSTVQRIIKHDCQLKVFKKVYCQKLSANVKEKRLERCNLLLRRFRSRENIAKIWFSDEKMFYLRPPKNTQNNRVYANVRVKREIPLENLLIERSHFSPGVMVSVAVSKLGKSSLIVVDAGVKLNSDAYQQQILHHLLPEIEAICDDYVFQQDGAPSHTSRSTRMFLFEQCPDYIEPEMWPPNSPDLNPVDYSIWGILEANVHNGQRFNTIEELKERLQFCWNNFNQDIINAAIDLWRRRLQSVIENHGGHIHNVIL